MKTFRLAMRPVLGVLACALLAACAQTPPKQTDMDYRSRPSATTKGATGTPGSSDQRLTIQSGEGERLNLPWFVRDAQDWVNSN